ncbi:PAS domain S-box-containing protein/diguanylate cyclase (GGDEF)-like protein [Trinickia symbiotica]|uniref:Bifunctional diguanylate cyclase/phosphodiesterase n=1 Tax=Trinickia symbiotica TaxID=863227 RepID=A0A2N7WYE7_9BURK|nr:EAL domain-containing protein [Trinickia symbiotica]PMS34536.1 bifunctional diguanylate cyclase/phosphodiesterase [Trinickia symbiotica]PPK43127.1 PAS domain S-box-containing protein/diguanylate cyclase (GGDEF)-like protein [Trinickia symbiotica]
MIRARLVLLPLVILLAGLGITWAVWNHERQASRHELLAQFNFELGDAVGRIEQRMAAYEQLLRGVQALFVATGTMDRARFHDYVNSVSSDANFSGIQALGLVQWVPAAGKAAHIEMMRETVDREYTIVPAGTRESYAPIVQREPPTDRRRRVLGFDAWAVSARRLALEKSRDSSLAVVSGKVQLAVDEGDETQPGFVIYLPVYAQGVPLDTIEQRRAGLIGWVYASFRMRDVIASLYGQLSPGLSLTIYDGVEPTDAALLYRSPNVNKRPLAQGLSSNEYLVVGGHEWVLSMVALDGFQNRFERDSQTLILVTGTGLSLLLALLAWVMGTGRNRAMRLASAMTKELRISAVAFESMEGMMVTDASGRILRVNSAFTACTGYRAEELVGKMPSILQSDRHDKAFYRDMWDTIHRTGGWQGEIWDRRKNGEIYPKWLTITAVRGDDGNVTHYVGTHNDITERKIAEERIKELAFFDALTRLPNRRLLWDRLRQAIAVSAQNETCGGLLFIDLDNFKTLNDTLGHDKGDMLLQQTAQRLLACVREGDTVARVGGDEFVLVLGSLSTNEQDAASQIEAIGEKILAMLGKPYQLEGADHRSTASIGATMFRGHQATIEELLKQADLAMYKSKERGRNAMCFFDPTMQTVVVERVAMEAALRRGIDEAQFLLHYQAQVGAGNRVTGAEALVRWQHPERGIVAPAEFITLAEESGLVLPLGYKVLEDACARLARWSGEPELAHLTLAVNVSAQQFRQPGFVGDVLSIIGRTGADPNRLKLELTESVVVDNVQDIIDKMAALKAVGVSFSLDDFGIGYSSLSYLKQLPLDELKIDRSFVRDILIDPNDAVIARTIVALAQSLGLDVIAEGVENEAQRDFLERAGCHAWQGYFFCRPVPVAEFEAFASRNG